MFNFKALAATALIGATAFIAPGAEAKSYKCYDTVNDDRVCVYAVRGNDYERSYKMDVNGKYAGIQYVTCPAEFRYNYKANANGIACYEFS